MSGKEEFGEDCTVVSLWRDAALGGDKRGVSPFSPESVTRVSSGDAADAAGHGDCVGNGGAADRGCPFNRALPNLKATVLLYDSRKYNKC